MIRCRQGAKQLLNLAWAPSPPRARHHVAGSEVRAGRQRCDATGISASNTSPPGEDLACQRTMVQTIPLTVSALN